MRKRTVNHLSDTIFWYLIYLFPVLIYLFCVFRSGNVESDFVTMFNGIGLGFVTDNPVMNTLKGIFFTDGVVPMFSTDTPFIIFTWFICTYVLHLAVDVILFIPRFAHRYMSKASEE